MYLCIYDYLCIDVDCIQIYKNIYTYICVWLICVLYFSVVPCKSHNHSPISLWSHCQFKRLDIIQQNNKLRHQLLKSIMQSLVLTWNWVLFGHIREVCWVIWNICHFYVPTILQIPITYVSNMKNSTKNGWGTILLPVFRCLKYHGKASWYLNPSKWRTLHHTVDGRNPAPPRM